MKNTLFAAATLLGAFAATSASAITYTTFCESGGTGTGFTTANVVSRCDAGEINAGADISTYNGGTFGPGQGLIFQGSGDNYDADSWSFTATSNFSAWVDLFAGNGAGVQTGVINATISGFGSALNLVSSVSAPTMLAFLAGGTYTFSVTGSGPLPTNIYNYDLRVEAVAPVPLPAGALLLGTALAGLGAVRRRKAKV